MSKVRILVAIPPVWFVQAFLQIRLSPFDQYFCDLFLRLRSWHPAVVMGLLDLPVEVQQQLGRNPDGMVTIKKIQH